MHIGGLPSWVSAFWSGGGWYPCRQDSVAGNHLPMSSRVQCERATVLPFHWTGCSITTVASQVDKGFESFTAGVARFGRMTIVCFLIMFS